jgi:hypothetical protein
VLKEDNLDLDHKVLKDRKVHKVGEVQQDLKERKDLRVLKVPKGQRVVQD